MPWKPTSRTYTLREKGNRMEEKEERVSIPFIMETMDTHNRRMLIALLSVCITFVLTIVIFVVLTG